MFYNSLEKLPSPPLAGGKKFFDTKTAEKLQQAEKLRRFVLWNFDYCDMLNGAIFDGLVHLHPLGGSVGAINPKKSDLVNLMDGIAKKATEFIQLKYEEVDLIVRLIYKF